MSDDITVLINGDHSEVTDVYSIESYFNPNMKPIGVASIIREILEYTGQTVPIEQDMSLEELKTFVKTRLAKARSDQEGVPDRIRSRLVLLHMLFPQRLRFTFISDKDGVGETQPPAVDDVHEVGATGTGAAQ